jgi:hypothetical protein
LSELSGSGARCLAHYPRQPLRSGDRGRAVVLFFFFLLNQLGPTQDGPVTWANQKMAGLGAGTALVAGGRNTPDDLCAQAREARRRASVAIRVTPDPRRSPSWGAGRAGCVVFFFFTRFRSDLVKLSREEHVYSQPCREEEGDQRGIKRRQKLKRRCRKERGS